MKILFFCAAVSLFLAISASADEISQSISPYVRIDRRECGLNKQIDTYDLNLVDSVCDKPELLPKNFKSLEHFVKYMQKGINSDDLQRAAIAKTLYKFSMSAYLGTDEGKDVISEEGQDLQGELAAELNKQSHHFWNTYAIDLNSGLIGLESRDWCRLSDSELIVLRDYTGPAYGQLNRILRGGMPDPKTQGQKKNFQEVMTYKALLNSALSKLPAYKGTVYRTTTLPPEVLTEYKVGKTIIHKAFTSASTGFSSFGDYCFVMKSRTGRAIRAFSQNPSEEEVLFRSGTKFKILKIAEDPRGDDDGDKNPDPCEKKFYMEEVN